MKILEKEFKKKGFNHKQLKRDGELAIYERWKDVEAPHFEVIKIGSHNGYELGGTYIEPAETYPSDGQWGTAGWTYLALEEAEKKFKYLLRGRKSQT